ncbi:hypothetical protein [Mycobacterium angelicum]|uniref:UsfY protein n=1 Tax=Mycobacterium angelicum TaxID=470074 RepID=A0A1W9ZY61_MYCAN|nr:hypothetical protein [Mycobacterium angelicum]MCV7198086.1 hypothetical protein [Mycobacterium angelicum]ORA22709.1 hypothetical protein BST12_09070 [Mycobacterium angelicum]
MDHLKSDPVDHHRTTRQHAGESLIDGANAGGVASVVVGVIALIVGLFALATREVVVGVVAVIVAVAAVGAGLFWLRHTHRRVRKAELRWHEAHSDEAPPPSS